MMYDAPGTYCGMRIIVLDAQQQRRTERNVRGMWMRPKVPSKRAGRRGTRRAWKRKHPPGYIWLYREPADVLVINNEKIIVTPAQHALIKRHFQTRGAHT